MDLGDAVANSVPVKTEQDDTARLTPYSQVHASEGPVFVHPEHPQAWTQYRSQEADSPCVTPQFKMESRMAADVPDLRRHSALMFSMDECGPSTPSVDFPFTMMMNELSCGFQSLGDAPDGIPPSPATTDQQQQQQQPLTGGTESFAAASALGIMMHPSLGGGSVHMPATPPGTPLSHQALLMEPLDMSLASLSSSAPSLGSSSSSSFADMYHSEVAYLCQQHYQLFQQQHPHLGFQLAVRHPSEHAQFTSWPAAASSSSSPPALEMGLYSSSAAAAIETLSSSSSPSSFSSSCSTGLTAEHHEEFVARSTHSSADVGVVMAQGGSGGSGGVVAPPPTSALRLGRRRPYSMVAYTAVDFPSPSPSSPGLASTAPSSPALDRQAKGTLPATGLAFDDEDWSLSSTATIGRANSGGSSYYTGHYHHHHQQQQQQQQHYQQQQQQQHYQQQQQQQHYQQQQQQQPQQQSNSSSNSTGSSARVGGNDGSGDNGDGASDGGGTSLHSRNGAKRSKPQYVCLVANCNRTFARPFNLRSHGMTHEPQRPYKCGLCSRSFSRVHDRDRHVKGHLHNKPYGCPVCQGRFARQDAVTRHLKLAKGTNGCAMILTQQGFRIRDAAAGRVTRGMLGNEEDVQCVLAKYNDELRKTRTLLKQQAQQQQRQQQQQQQMQVQMEESGKMESDDDIGLEEEEVGLRDDNF